MKKVLSFVLVLAMILGSFSMVFAATFSDVEANDDHEEAINVLSSLGVVSGYTDGTFKPEKVVTRAEMAAFIINALFGEDKQITQRATNFSDVTAAHWASGFVDYANTLDIIAGYTDGTFKPNQTVTYNEAITMLVKALGYRDAALNGSYPASYVNQAKALGLLEDVDGLGTADAARGDIAQLVYNALNCPIGTVNKDGEWIPNKSGDTMLKRLGGSYDDVAVIIGEDDVEEAIVDISEYLGAYAKVVRTKVNGPIAGVYSVESTFVEGKFDSAKNTFGDYKTGRAEASTDPDAISFNNGVQDATFTVPATGKTYKLAADISGKYIETVYSVQYWEPTVTKQVTEPDLEDLEDAELFDKSFATDDDDEIKTSAFILEGAASLEDIEEDDVVTLFVGGTGSDAHITKIQVGTAITGEVTKISSDDKLTINGSTYELSDDYTETDEIKFGSEGTFYLDFAGDIFTFAADEEETTDTYVIYLEKGEDSSRYGDTVKYVKAFNADGKVVEYEVSSKYTLPTVDNGTLVKLTVNDDELVTKVETATAFAGEKSFNTKGVCGTDKLATSTVVFKYTGTTTADLKDEDCYKVVTASTLFDNKVTAASTFKKDGAFNALLISGVADDTDDVYVAFTGEWYVSGESEYTYEVLYNGEVKEFASEDDSFKTGMKYTTGASVLYKLVLNDSNEITGTATKTVTPVAPSFAGTTAVADGQMKDASKAYYALADDVVVYVCDDEGEWSVGKTSALAGKNLDVEAYLYDTDADTEYDFVLVFEK